MNHLEEAKKQFEIICSGGVQIPPQIELLKAHALIAIAEQLEKIVKGIELPRIVIETPED